MVLEAVERIEQSIGAAHRKVKYNDSWYILTYITGVTSTFVISVQKRTEVLRNLKSKTSLYIAVTEYEDGRVTASYPTNMSDLICAFTNKVFGSDD